MRSVIRYKNLSPKSVKIHPLKRLASWLALCLPESWRFFILGLPVRSSGTVAVQGDSEVSFFADGIACNQGAHLTPSGTYIPQLTLGAGPFMETRFLQKQRCFPKIRTMPGTTASLVFEGQHNYYRWLMETLPRMRFLREKQIEYDWLYACQKQPFHRQSLEMLGCNPAQIIDCEQAPYLCARKLVVPRFADETEEWIVPWLREQFLPHADDRGSKSLPRRIHIIRARASSRSVANQAELLELLGSWGFVPVVLEDLNWKEQLDLFKNAEAIAGPHGAGLANLVFCPSAAWVLELIPQDYPFTFYPQISRQLGLRHHLISCPSLKRSMPTDSPIQVPLNEVRDVLKASFSGS